MNLNNMTVTQLRDMASDLSIAGRSKMRKAELIEAITAHREAEEGVTQDAELEYHEDEDGFAYYLPKTETATSADHNPDTQGLPTAMDIIADTVPQRVYTEPVKGEVAILRDAPGRAIVTAAIRGRTFGASITTERGRKVLRYGNVKIRANSFEKLAKRFAKLLNFYAERIDVARSF